MAVLDDQSSANRDDTPGMDNDNGAVQQGAEEAMNEHSESQQIALTERVVAPVETANVDRKSEIPAATSVASTEALTDDPVVLIDTRQAHVSDEVVADVSPDISSVTADVVSAPQDQQQEGVHGFVTGRMALAEEDLQDLRLTTPQGNNALEHYRDVLALLPEHGGALAGLQRIVEMYTQLIDTALQKGQLAIAQLYLSRAQEVIPGAPSLLRAKQDLRSVDVEAVHE
jgi:hypothetical protein